MNKFKITLIAAAAIALAGCSKELVEPQEVDVTVDGSEIIATAIVRGAVADTKVNYNDGYSAVETIADITAGSWQVGDSFGALEINGSTVTAVTFTTSETGASVKFKASGAVAADENTKWVAVTGNTTVADGTLICSYDGQDGTVGNIGKYDYVLAQGSGQSPVFDFSSRNAKPLTYLMRIVLPAGIKYIEFNTGKDRNGGWNVTSEGKTQATTSCTEKEAVRLLTLPAVSSAKQIAYLAVPAIDLMHSSENRLAGLIVTIMSADKRLSQGKVTSANLATKGGRTGTFDMSGLELMARPLASEAIKLGKVSYDGVDYILGNWAPFNVGGDVPTSDEAIAGNLYAWAETEPKASFSLANYRWNNGGNYQTQRGYKYVGAVEGVPPFIEVHYAGGKGFQHGPGTFYEIGGTKYDVARVKWGSEWRIPSNEMCCNILRDSEYRLTEAIDKDNKVTFDEYDPGTYTNSSNYKSDKYGVVVFKANGAQLALYRCSYTDNGSTDNSGSKGRYWMSCTDYGTEIYGTTPNYWNRACQLRIDHDDNYVNNKSWVWDGLRVRAVLNE